MECTLTVLGGDGGSGGGGDGGDNGGGGGIIVRCLRIVWLKKGLVVWGCKGKR